jgi:hypothetical protein
VDAFSKIRMFSIRSKIPFKLACSNNSHKPAFEVRILAENSILFITATSFARYICFPSQFQLCYLIWRFRFTQWVR